MENELKFKFLDPEAPLYEGIQNRTWVSKEEAFRDFPNQPERSKREDHHLTLDDFSDNPSKEQLGEEMKIIERKILDAVL